MAIYTYTGNSDPNDKTSSITLRAGLLVLKMGQYADLTGSEILLISGSGKYVIQAGIVSPSIPATVLPSYSVPTFVPNADYPANYVILQGGSLYYSNVDFIAGASFNSSDWTTANPGPAGGPGPAAALTISLGGT